MQEKILLVEDDRDIVDYLSNFLKNENFIVEAVAGQREAIEKLETREYDLLLIDISLARRQWICSLCGGSEKSPAAVIFLTASGDEYSVVTGLDMGADDYINKPFHPRELVSRIRSVLRRTGKSQKLLKRAEYTVDTVKGIVYRNGEELALSALEYRLLLIFFNNKGVVFIKRPSALGNLGRGRRIRQ